MTLFALARLESRPPPAWTRRWGRNHAASHSQARAFVLRCLLMTGHGYDSSVALFPHPHVVFGC